MDALYENYQNQWNLVRFTSYIAVKCAGSKLEKPSDLIRFPWDLDDIIEPEILTNDEIEAREKEMLEWFNKK